MKNERTNKAVAKLAAKILKHKSPPKDVAAMVDRFLAAFVGVNRSQLLKVAASCLTQAPDKKGKP